MADENTMLRGCRTTCTPPPEAPGRGAPRRGNITSDKIRRYYGEIYF